MSAAVRAAELVSGLASRNRDPVRPTSRIHWLGLPSATATDPFDVRASLIVKQKNGLCFYGVSGRAALPFLGGTRCVLPALRRLAIQSCGGSPPPAGDCSGSYAFDFNAWIQSGQDPFLVPGQAVNAPYWGRDPVHPDGTGASSTDALEFAVCP